MTATSPAPTTSSVPASVAAGVWFPNSSHAATGEEPLCQPVHRRVQPPALAARALDALFAGPSGEEQAAGLRLVTSGSTGYTRLHIGDGAGHFRATVTTRPSTVARIRPVTGRIRATVVAWSSHLGAEAARGGTNSRHGGAARSIVRDSLTS